MGVTTIIEAPPVHPDAVGLTAEPVQVERRIGWLFAGTGTAVLCVLGLAGITMRLTQASVLPISQQWFYRLMTLHGEGMIGGALMAMMGALWFVLHATLPLNVRRMLASYVMMVGGLLAIIFATIVGGFAAAWTFLAPLPFDSAGQWQPWATAVFLIGMVVFGAGFFVYCLDVLEGAMRAHGGLTGALGLKYLFGRSETAPPPQVIAAMVISLDGLLTGVIGMTILMAMIDKLIAPGELFDSLWAKDLTYFFGHSIANLIIYMASGVVYVLLPRYAGRPWKTTKPIVIGWLGTLTFLVAAYSHHLYMDFAQPQILQVISQGASYGSSMPVAVVTIYSGMMLVWASRYRWTLASTLLYVGFAGWVIGGVGALIDSTIAANFRFHNTLWVVGHFHTYLMLCVVVWVLAFVVHLAERAAGRTAARTVSMVTVGAMMLGGYGLVGVWFVLGALGVPRRYAVQPPVTHVYDIVAGGFALLFAAGILLLLIQVARLVLEAHRTRQTQAPSDLAVDTVSRSDGVAEPDIAALGVKRATTPLSARLVPPLATELQIGVGALLATVALIALLPPVIDMSEVTIRGHHLDHAAIFIFGGLVGLTAASLWLHRHPRNEGTGTLTLATVVLAPVLMLLAMTPSVYAPLEGHETLHALYHLGIAALGLASGLAAARFGKAGGRIAFFLMAGMGVIFAAGMYGR